MDEKEYDVKYGIDSSRIEVKSFHKGRRMFSIRDKKLYLGPVNAEYSHAKWFEILGWMTPEDDFIMNIVTRGYFDKTGVYFYKGYDFDIDEECEKEMLGFLEELVLRCDIDTKLHLFGGRIKQEPGTTWPVRRDYGSIQNIIR